MGSQQSKQNKLLEKKQQEEELQKRLQVAKETNAKYRIFYEKFLNCIEAIAARPTAIEFIVLANGVSVPLSWEILVKRFPGCVQTRYGLLTHQRIFIGQGPPIMFNGRDLAHPQTFWEYNDDKVREFFYDFDYVYN